MYDSDILKKCLMHTFKGWNFCYDDLKKMEKVKIYKDGLHFKRFLYKASNGMMFLYEFYEYIDFDYREYEIYETYVYVTCEEEADMVNWHQYLRGYGSYIYVIPNYNIKINE